MHMMFALQKKHSNIKSFWARHYHAVSRRKRLAVFLYITITNSNIRCCNFWPACSRPPSGPCHAKAEPKVARPNHSMYAIYGTTELCFTDTAAVL